jgi:hypothetical protein
MKKGEEMEIKGTTMERIKPWGKVGRSYFNIFTIHSEISECVGEWGKGMAIVVSHDF